MYPYYTPSRPTQQTPPMQQMHQTQAMQPRYANSSPTPQTHIHAPHSANPTCAQQLHFPYQPTSAASSSYRPAQNPQSIPISHASPQSNRTYPQQQQQQHIVNVPGSQGVQYLTQQQVQQLMQQQQQQQQQQQIQQQQIQQQQIQQQQMQQQQMQQQQMQQQQMQQQQMQQQQMQQQQMQQQQMPQPKGDEDGRRIGSYLLGKTLGEGAFGKVKLATHIATKEVVAVKIFHRSQMDVMNSMERIQREIDALQKLKHPNIIRLLDVIEEKDPYVRPTTGANVPKRIYLVLEYAQHGDLLDYTTKRLRLSEAETRRLMKQIISAVDHCHLNQIVHRDIKLENVLLDKNDDAKLTDFGLCNSIQGSGGDADLLRTICGSPTYNAPEMLLGHPYTPAVDVWALGVTLYALLNGYFPFDEPNQQLLCQRIISGKFHAPTYGSESVKDLIRRILQPDPKLRFTIADIFKHPWMQESTPLPTPPPEVRTLADGGRQQSQLYRINKRVSSRKSNRKSANRDSNGGADAHDSSSSDSDSSEAHDHHKKENQAAVVDATKKPTADAKAVGKYGRDLSLEKIALRDSDLDPQEKSRKAQVGHESNTTTTQQKPPIPQLSQAASGPLPLKSDPLGNAESLQKDIPTAKMMQTISSLVETVSLMKDQMEKDRKQHKIELEAQQQTQVALEKQIQQIQDTVGVKSTSQQKVESLSEKIDDLLTCKKDSDRERSLILRRLETHQGLLESLTNGQVRLDQGLSKLQDEARTKAKSKSYDSAESILNSLTRKVEETVSHRDQLEAELNKLKQQFDALSDSERIGIHQRSLELDEINRKHEESIARLKEKQEQQSRRVIQELRDLRESKADAKEFRKLQDSFDKELSSSNMQNSVLSTTVQALQVDIESFKKDRVLGSRIEELFQCLEGLMDERETVFGEFDSSLQAMKTELDAVVSQSKSLQNTLSELSEELLNMKESRQATNGVMRPEIAIPIIVDTVERLKASHAELVSRVNEMNRRSSVLSSRDSVANTRQSVANVLQQEMSLWKQQMEEEQEASFKRIESAIEELKQTTEKNSVTFDGEMMKIKALTKQIEGLSSIKEQFHILQGKENTPPSPHKRLAEEKRMKMEEDLQTIFVNIKSLQEEVSQIWALKASNIKRRQDIEELKRSFELSQIKYRGSLEETKRRMRVDVDELKTKFDDLHSIIERLELNGVATERISLGNVPVMIGDDSELETSGDSVENALNSSTTTVDLKAEIRAATARYMEMQSTVL